MLEQTRAKSLEQALATYAEKKQSLLASGHAGRWVLIFGDEVIGIYESRARGLADGYRRIGNAPFLVREITDRLRPMQARVALA